MAESGSHENQPPLSFEESLTQLQLIVAQLEDGAQGLEASMQQFEQGIGLLRNCYRMLAEAEQKIEILTGVDEQGNPVVAPFDGTATFDRPEKSAGRRRSQANGEGEAPAGDQSLF